MRNNPKTFCVTRSCA